MSLEPPIEGFRFDHLPPDLQAVSKPFYELAVHMIDNLSPNTERAVALRKLLEAKDCAVRSAIYSHPTFSEEGR